MATATSALRFDLFAKDHTGPGIRSAESGFSKLGKGLVAKFAAAGAAIGAVSLFKGFISEAAESAKIGRMTDAVVKSTGMSAHIAAGAVADLATELSNKNGVDDEAIQSGQNLLLTFTNVRNEIGKGNDIFNQASQAAIDMTSALNGGDVSAEKIKGSSIMLGKALNDPIKGITALTRSGVTFTEAQKKQIKAMVEAGDKMGAQKIILGELKTEFGGMAAAATSPAEKAKVAWGNLQEQIGGYFLPVLGRMATFLSTKIIPAVSRFLDNVKNGGGTFATIREKVAQFSGFITSTVVPALKKFGDWFVTTALPKIREFAAKLREDLQPVIAQVATSFRDDIVPALKGLIDKFKEAWPNIQRVLVILGQLAEFILTKVVPVLVAFYAKYLSKVISVLGSLFTTLWRVIGAMIDAGEFIVKTGQKFYQFYNAVRDALAKAQSAVADKIGKVVSTISAMPGKAISALGDMGSKLYQAGVDFVQGFINGIKQKAAEIPGTVKDWVVDKATSIITLGLKSSSPSRVTMQYGRWFSEGFAIGIKDKSADVMASVKDMLDKLKEKIQVVRDFARAIRDAFMSAGNVTGIDTMIAGLDGDTEGGFPALLAGLQAKAKAAAEFAAGLTKLRKMGLNATSLTQLREAGPESGLKATQQLLSGGAGGIGQVNALTAQIAAQGAALGEREAKATFGYGTAGPNKATIKGGGQPKVQVSFDMTGAGEDALIKAIRKAIRVRGGDVQVALGSK